MPRKYERSWTSPEHSPEEELAGWIEMHIMGPFQQQSLHAAMSEGQLHFGKGQNHGRPFFSPHPTRDNGKPLPQADVETATLQPKEDPA